jgi:hypothetical protein
MTVQQESRTLDGARAWVAAWQDGWERHDPEVVAARYALDCRFRSAPFRALEHGREAALAYARQSFDEESRATFTFAEPARMAAPLSSTAPSSGRPTAASRRRSTASRSCRSAPTG